MVWGELASSQDGIISRRQLRDHGVSDQAVGRLISSGALNIVCRGVFLARGAPLTYRARLQATVLGSDGVVGLGTALHLWGLSETEPDAIDIVVAPSLRPRAVPFARVHRIFVPRSAIVQRDRLPVTTRTWTVLDQLGRLPKPAAYRLADRALQRDWVRRADIERRLADLPNRLGNRQLAEIARRTGDGAAAESERVLHRILRSAGISNWQANYAIWHGGELIAVVDVAAPEARLAIEVDGFAYHSDVDRFQRDRERQNALVSLGWRVVRFTWADLTTRPGYVVSTIRHHVR